MQRLTAGVIHEDEMKVPVLCAARNIVLNWSAINFL